MIHLPALTIGKACYERKRDPQALALTCYGSVQHGQATMDQAAYLCL